MSTRQVRMDHRVVHVGDWTHSNAFYRDVLGAEVPTSTHLGAAHRSPGGGYSMHGPGATPTCVPVPPGGGAQCFEWTGPVAEAAHLDRRGMAVEPDPLRRPGGCGFGQSVYKSLCPRSGRPVAGVPLRRGAVT